jgi:cytochrome P450
MSWASGVTRVTGPISLLLMVTGLLSMKRYLVERLEAGREGGGECLIAELVSVEKEGRADQSHRDAVDDLCGAFCGTRDNDAFDQWIRLRAARYPGLRGCLEEDWSRTSLAVEELLWFVSPVQSSKPRFVRRDVALRGAQLKKGEQIVARLVAANMDPHANEHTEKLDLERKANRHLAFGTGIHFCLEHQLARVEGRYALEALFKRRPKLELAVEDSQIRRRKRPGTRAINRLPVVASR